jgi:hypothetical protein
VRDGLLSRAAGVRGPPFARVRLGDQRVHLRSLLREGFLEVICLRLSSSLPFDFRFALISAASHVVFQAPSGTQNKYGNAR